MQFHLYSISSHMAYSFLFNLQCILLGSSPIFMVRRLKERYSNKFVINVVTPNEIFSIYQIPFFTVMLYIKYLPSVGTFNPKSMITHHNKFNPVCVQKNFICISFFTAFFQNFKIQKLPYFHITRDSHMFYGVGSFFRRNLIFMDFILCNRSFNISIFFAGFSFRFAFAELAFCVELLITFATFQFPGKTACEPTYWMGIPSVVRSIQLGLKDLVRN